MYHLIYIYRAYNILYSFCFKYPHSNSSAHVLGHASPVDIVHRIPLCTEYIVVHRIYRCASNISLCIEYIVVHRIYRCASNISLCIEYIVVHRIYRCASNISLCIEYIAPLFSSSFVYWSIWHPLESLVERP